MKQNIILHPRKCDITGEGMHTGYCIGEGQMYIKYESDMIKHLRKIEKEGNDEYDKLVAEGRLTDDYLFNEYYQADYYYYTDWEDPDDMQFAEINGVLYEEGTPEFDDVIALYKIVNKLTKTDSFASIDINSVTPDQYTDLKLQVNDLFNLMDKNTTSLWRDDLECTHECVVLEDVEDGVKVDENDNPTMACNGNSIGLLMDRIKQIHLG